LKEWVPAKAIALIHTAEEPAALQRASRLGFTPRWYGQNLAFWLPDYLTLSEVLDCFQGIAIDSAAIQPVQLEHVYLEITRQAGSASSP
jgi:ABC-2 type transport system ATP-binding protein